MYIQDFFCHLFRSYDQITPLNLCMNETKIKMPFNPNNPIENLYKQIKEGQTYAEDGGWPYTDHQLVNIILPLIIDSGAYPLDVWKWIWQPFDQKTYHNLNTHFIKAKCHREAENTTSGIAGYTKNLSKDTDIINIFDQFLGKFTKAMANENAYA